MRKRLEDFLSSYLHLKKKLSPEQLKELAGTIETEYQTWFLSTIIQEIEEIMAIDPRLPLKEILEIGAERIVQNLAADAATIRMFDQKSLKMISFGAYGVSDYDRLASIEVQNSLSGRVIQERRAIAVPSILKDPLYKNKAIVKARGFHSLLAVPLIMPTPVSSGTDILGTLQIYYQEEDREFDSLEIIHAELLARRISFVLAKKKILDLEELNIRKETIVNKIFVKLSRKENIKLKDLFVLLIPEIEKLIEIKSCSLLTVSDDQKFINLAAGYPQDDSYHEAGHSFTVAHHPYFQAIIEDSELSEDREYERITESYILIKDPAKSSMVSRELVQFTRRHQIHSILLVPLRVDGKVRHVLAFYAAEQKQFFSDEEIDLLTFFGKEIMKATRLEFLGDVLHDIKNPAIAVAGFAGRARKLLEEQDLEQVRGKLISYLDLIASESSRMQDLAQAMTGEGREELLDLAAVAAARYKIIEEVIRESKLKVRALAPALGGKLLVSCPRFALERVLDNLLGNAVRAVPEDGGTIAMHGYPQDNMACLAIENTGEISPERLEQLRQGAVKGRGLNIIKRFVHANHGNLEIESRNGATRFIISFPLQASRDN
jgi:signal transduction histidine kinase